MNPNLNPSHVCDRHPHIIRLLDSILVASRFYFVMEFASGGSLVDFVHARVHNMQPPSPLSLKHL